MKATAALAGGFLLLATYPAMGQGVSGSVNVTGGATPSVTTSATTASTATGTSSSQSSSDPVITNSGNTGSSILTNRNGARSNAQGGNARSNAQGGRASAATSSRSQGGAGGYAGAVGNQVQVIQEGYTGTTTGGGSYSGTTTQNYSGGYTLRNVPEIVAPSVNGGANGCAVGVSGGVAVAGFGITTGAGWSDSNCERRNLAALVFNTGEKELAQEILCDAAVVRAARLRMGKPCIADQQPQAVTVGASEAQHIDPAILRRQQDSLDSQQPMRVGGGIAATAVVDVHRRPDWCDTASPQEQRIHKECD